jgi:hypothetical protein
LEILIIWHLRGVVPGSKVLLFMTKKTLSVKQAVLRDIFKKASKSICTSTVVVSPDSLSPTPTQENTKEDADDSELADKRGIQMECTSN